MGKGKTGMASGLPFCHKLRSVGAMYRPLRFEFPGALFHLASRAAWRKPILVDADNRRALLEVFEL